MPRRSRKITRKQKLPCSPTAWAILTDEPLAESDPDYDPWEAFELDGTGGHSHRPTLQSTWQQHGPAVLEKWIAARPGTRPNCWWRFDAPGAPLEVPADQAEFLREHNLLTKGEG